MSPREELTTTDQESSEEVGSCSSQEQEQAQKDATTTTTAAAAAGANFRDPIFPLWTRCTLALHSRISRGVTTLALHAVKFPKTYIICITVLSFVLVAAGYFTGFQLELDMAMVFTPVNSLPQKHNDWIFSNEGFPHPTRNVQMVFHNHGANILQAQQARRVLEAVDVVRETPGFQELCAQGAYVDFDSGEPTCRILSISGYWGHNVEWFDALVWNSDEQLRTSLSRTQFSNGSPVFPDAILGNYIKDDNGIMKEAQSYLVLIDLPIVGDGTITDDFETKLLERLDDLRRYWIDLDATATASDEDAVPLTLDIMSVYAFKSEGLRAIFSDIYLVPICVFLMVGFTCLIFYRRDKVQSRCLLGIASVVTICMSMLTGMGIMFCFGVPYSVVHQMLPFVVFGIGLDDTFIITGAYFRTNPSDSVETRIRHTMQHVGWSISVTTMTTIFAFLLGYVSSSFPGVHWLCLYAMVIIAVDFLYQITYFVAWMVLDERRIAANRRDCCFWITVPRDDVDDDEHHDNNNNNTDTNAEPEQEETDPSSHSDDASPDTGRKDKGAQSDNKEFTSTTVPDRVMRWYAKFLLRRPVQITVLVFFTLFFAACCYSATLLRQEFNVADYVPNDSYLKNSFHSLEEYCSVVRPLAVYFRHVDQTDMDVQQQMIQYIEDLESLEQIGSGNISAADLAAASNSNSNLTMTDISSSQLRAFCWVRDFQDFEQQYAADITDPTLLQVLEDMTFLQRLDLALADPVIREVYGQDIVRDENGNITASRCYLFIRNIDLKSVQEQMDVLEDQREVAMAQPINQGKQDWPFFAFEEMFFYWEAYTVAVDELIFTMVAGVVAVTLISFVFMPNYTAALFVCPMIIILYINLLGTIRFLGLNINGLTYICVVVSIGLLVDFLIHILLRYYESTSPSREERVKETLETMGVSILVGGLTTFLGVIPLAISSLEIFYTVFGAFFGMILLGTTHGLVLLPVLLSFVGPTTTVRGHAFVDSEGPIVEKDMKINRTESGYTTILPHGESRSRVEDEDI